MSRKTRQPVIKYSYVAATAEVEEAESGNKNNSFSYIENLEDQVVYYVQLKIKTTFPFDARDFPWPQLILLHHNLLQRPCLLRHYKNRKNNTLALLSLSLSVLMRHMFVSFLLCLYNVVALVCCVREAKKKQKRKTQRKRQDSAGRGQNEEGSLGNKLILVKNLPVGKGVFGISSQPKTVSYTSYAVLSNKESKRFNVSGKIIEFTPPSSQDLNFDTSFFLKKKIVIFISLLPKVGGYWDFNSTCLS